MPELAHAMAELEAILAEFPDKLIRVRLDPTVALSSFIEKAANAFEACLFIGDRAKTSAGQVGISGGDLKRLPIPIAPVPEQKRIADKLDKLLARINASRSRLVRAAAMGGQFRQSVLAEATSSSATSWIPCKLGDLLVDVRYGTSKRCDYGAAQKAIAARATRLLALADSIATRIEAARRICDRQVDSVLAKAFRSELVPQDPSDEPAQAMLGRL